MKTGEGGALAGLPGIAFACGVFHAARPGHGKALIGGYGVARRVALWRLMALSPVSSLAQATLAVLLVQAGIAVFDRTRERVVGAAEQVIRPASPAAAALIGPWPAWRGMRGIVRGIENADHGHTHDAHCGLRHAPAPKDAAAVTTPREALVLILPVPTWQMGIAGAGIANAVMTLELPTAAL